MKRGPFTAYEDWLKTVDTETLQNWLKREIKLIMEGNELAVVFKGPYPVIQETGDSDEDFANICGPLVEVPRMQRLQWFATELERRANGGTVAENVRL